MTKYYIHMHLNIKEIVFHFLVIQQYTYFNYSAYSDYSRVLVTLSTGHSNPILSPIGQRQSLFCKILNTTTVLIWKSPHLMRKAMKLPESLRSKESIS